MKDVYGVLAQKESDLARVRKEIESLTLAAQLLADDEFDPCSAPEQSRKPTQRATAPKATGTDGEPFVWPRLDFWGNLRIKR